MTHPLDRPVWNTLSTRHTPFSSGGARARRFVPDIGPLAGARDDEPDSLAALAELVPSDGLLLIVQAEPIVVPAGTLATTTAAGVQMVATELTPGSRYHPRGIERLTEADWPAMHVLATLTKPGPFAARTPMLGEFWGVKDGGVLVAMAGERMKHDGFTEVSGVCTHPDARGRGLARMLSTFVAQRIVERGETPYLHAYASNTPAIQLYETLGFRLRSPMHVAAIVRCVRDAC